MQVSESARDSRGHERFAVQSESGNAYQVTYEGTGGGDAEIVRTWSCTCPAYKYNGGACKHINAVIEFCNQREGANGMD